MEKIIVIFQDIIRYLLSAVTRKHKIQCVIKMQVKNLWKNQYRKFLHINIAY